MSDPQSAHPSPVIRAEHQLPLAPGVTEAFKRDTDKRKINLGVGAYRDENGKPYVLPSVREVRLSLVPTRLGERDADHCGDLGAQAEQMVVNKSLDKEYLPITGLSDFTSAAARLAYGADSAPIKEGRLAITQSVSGTGALRIGAAFMAKFYPEHKQLYMPTPTWGNHIPIAKDSGLEPKQYAYYDKSTVALDFEGLKRDMRNAPNKSVFLLHACAHNPTGVDPTQEQWREIAQIFKEKEHFPWFDMAYQGFASGDVDRDAFAPRYFVEQGMQIVLSQSFAKVRRPLSPLSVSAAISDGSKPPRATEHGSLRRASRRVLDRVRVARGKSKGRLADQDSRAAAVLEPARARRTHRVDDPQRRQAVRAVARRGQGHGRPHHWHAHSAL